LISYSLVKLQKHLLRIKILNGASTPSTPAITFFPFKISKIKIL
jgi:hypothetical protein